MNNCYQSKAKTYTEISPKSHVARLRNDILFQCNVIYTTLIYVHMTVKIKFIEIW